MPTSPYLSPSELKIGKLYYDVTSYSKSEQKVVLYVGITKIGNISILKFLNLKTKKIEKISKQLFEYSMCLITLEHYMEGLIF